jgi:UDP-glucose 4-epimerase
MTKRALVTGGYGFLGRYTARALAVAGFEVTAIGHGSWGRNEWRNWGITDWHLADVTLDTLVTYGRESDLVFHCAGSGSVPFSMTHPAQDFERSVTTTLAVLEYVRLYATGTRVVFPSSASVYGLAERMPISVQDRLAPISPYGVHKRIGEDLCRLYGKHFGVACAIVRLFSVYGVGLRKQLLWDACGKILNGDATFAGTGRETRDFIHVEDAAELLIHAARKASVDCPTANGGSGTRVSIAEIANEIALQFGRKEGVVFSGIVRQGDPLHYQADITEALAWGWIPKRCWRDEVRAYARWYRGSAQ